jgi:cobalt/nickel transport system ATP-binding protein
MLWRTPKKEAAFMNAIEVAGVSYRFPDSTEALRDVAFNIPAGAKAALLGPNGAGKSTLMQHLNGLILPQQGSIRIHGLAVDRTNRAAIRRKVGLVFQNPDDQVFSATVWEDVCFGPVNMGLPRAEVERKCDIALGSVGMRELKDKAPYHLSYGQKKRVAIAGVLAMDPDVIVLDEPMAYLDPQGKDELAVLLQTLHLLGKTVLVTTHDVDFAAEWADRVLLMKEGRIIASGSADLLIDEPLIKEARLHLPRVSRPFHLAGGLGFAQLPRNEKEAARRLWMLAGR